MLSKFSLLYNHHHHTSPLLFSSCKSETCFTSVSPGCISWYDTSTQHVTFSRKSEFYFPINTPLQKLWSAPCGFESICHHTILKLYVNFWKFVDFKGVQGSQVSHHFTDLKTMVVRSQVSVRKTSLQRLVCGRNSVC